MTSPFLRLTGVTKRYDGGGGVAGISLDVASGDALVVLGPSGSGKTTLLRLIAGLDRPDGGEIWLDGRVVAANGRNIVPARARRVGFVFQDLALWPHLTVAGNLQFVANAVGVEKGKRGSHIADVLRSCRIDRALFDRYPHELSGGEQQRVALARALVGPPRMVLLDEPFSNLDPDLRASLRHELASLHRELGLTAIYVTHDRADAEGLADRTFTIERAHASR